MDIPVSSSGAVAGAERVAALPQKSGWLERLINSPILLVVLVLVTITLAFKWYVLKSSLNAPVVRGWIWSEHPNSLLIYYPSTDCGCGPGLRPVFTQAEFHHLDVVVVSDVQGWKLARLTEQMGQNRSHTLVPATLDAMRQWCQAGNTEILCVKDGRIVHRMSGTNIPENFSD